MRLATYKSSKSDPDDLMKLRVYVEQNGVSMLNGLIRRCSCYKIDSDIDIQNGAPSIMDQVCKQHEVGAEPLAEYADDREGCWKAMQASFKPSYPVISPKVCKKLFNGMLNGGNYRNLLRRNKLPVKNNAYLKRFQDSAREAAKQLLALALDESRDTPQVWTLIAGHANEPGK
jgi:hypothetical protein